MFLIFSNFEAHVLIDIVLMKKKSVLVLPMLVGQGNPEVLARYQTYKMWGLWDITIRPAGGQPPAGLSAARGLAARRA